MDILGETTQVKKLKYSEIKSYREQQLIRQKNICALCKHDLTLEDAVLDHDHSTGRLRQVLHRFCNTFLGKIEGNVKRNRISDSQLTQILIGYEYYVHGLQDVLHPTHKTPEQKRALTKKRRARK